MTAEKGAGKLAAAVVGEATAPLPGRSGGRSSVGTEDVFRLWDCAPPLLFRCLSKLLLLMLPWAILLPPASRALATTAAARADLMVMKDLSADGRPPGQCCQDAAFCRPSAAAAGSDGANDAALNCGSEVVMTEGATAQLTGAGGA